MAASDRPAEVNDIHRIAMAMPFATCVDGSSENPIYQVGGKSFVFFRNPRPDAIDPRTGERFTDVVAFWTPTLEDKHVLVDDPDLPFFTTPHFDGYRAVLVRTSRINEMSLEVLREVVEDAWLSRASATRAKAWLADHTLA